MKWAFPGSIAVHVPLLEGKSGSLVMHSITEVGRCGKGAERGWFAWDQRDHISLPVRYSQIDGMTVSLQPRAVTASPLILYQSPPLSGILLRKQLRHRKFSKVRISIPGGQIGVGQFLGLCKVVDMLRTAESELRHLISLQNIEHLQNGHSLSIWRNFPNIISSIVHRDRFDPDG